MGYYNIKCNNQELLQIPSIKVKDDMVVYKLYGKDDVFLGSRRIPSDLYPLHKKDCMVFFHGNTKRITDERIIQLTDEIEYKIGRCYHNAENVATKLKENGIENVKLYTGWLLQGTLPIHHSWVMIEDCYLIDLTNDVNRMIQWMRDNNITYDDPSATKQELREILLSYRQFTVQTKMKNSERVELGSAGNYVYIGCEINSATEGIVLFNELTKKYPHHESYTNTDSRGRNPFIRMLEESNLL